MIGHKSYSMYIVINIERFQIAKGMLHFMTTMFGQKKQQQQQPNKSN